MDLMSEITIKSDKSHFTTSDMNISELFFRDPPTFPVSKILSTTYILISPKHEIVIEPAVVDKVTFAVASQ